jgi:hypothetical protein
MIWMFLLSNSVSPPKIVSYDDRPRLEIARGAYEAVAEIKRNAVRCGFENARHVVPNGDEAPTYLYLLKAELR